MDIAKCTTDGIIYRVNTFSSQSDEWINTHRYSLICSECGGRGYFRKKTKDGRAACFGARHDDNCDMGGHKVDQAEGHGVENVAQVVNQGQELDLRLDGPAPPRGADFRRRAEDDQPGEDHVRRYGGGGDGDTEVRNARSIGLRRLLNNLIHDNQYAQSDIRVNVEERGSVALRDLVREFREVTNGDLDRTMAVWGKVVSIGGQDDGPRYLNSGFAGDNPCFVTLPNNIYRSVLDLMDWENLGAIRDGHVIVVGKVYSAQDNRLKMIPSSINNIAFREPVE